LNSIKMITYVKMVRTLGDGLVYIDSSMQWFSRRKELEIIREERLRRGKLNVVICKNGGDCY